jgi:hypothetical protein
VKIDLPFQITLLLAAFVPLPALADIRYEQGKAWDMQKSRVLYTESHWSRFENGRISERTVLYRCADGTPFARKIVSYGNSALAPEFQFQDRRFDYSEGLRWQNGIPRVQFSGPDGKGERALDSSTSLVADAGFDNFIRQRWQALSRNDKQKLQFAVPARLKSYAFTLQRAGNTRYANQPAQIFKLGLDGWLGFIAPSITLTYSNRDQRLMQFKGLTNILGSRGDKPLNAIIEFPLNDQAADAKAKRAAQTVLLESCKVN